MRIKKLYAAILLGFLLPFPVLSQVTKEKEARVEKKFDSLQKSLLVPGWGQLVEKRYLEGFFFLSAEIFCIAYIAINNHKGNHYYSLYKEADNVPDAILYRELTEKYDTMRNQFLLAAATVWAVNLIDMYLIVKKKEKKKNLQLSLNYDEKQRLAFTFSCWF